MAAADQGVVKSVVSKGRVVVVAPRRRRPSCRKRVAFRRPAPLPSDRLPSPFHVLPSDPSARARPRLSSRWPAASAPAGPAAPVLPPLLAPAPARLPPPAAVAPATAAPSARARANRSGRPFGTSAAAAATPACPHLTLLLPSPVHPLPHPSPRSQSAIRPRTQTSPATGRPSVGGVAAALLPVRRTVEGWRSRLRRPGRRRATCR